MDVEVHGFVGYETVSLVSCVEDCDGVQPHFETVELNLHTLSGTRSAVRRAC